MDLKRILYLDALLSFFFALATAVLPALLGFALGGLAGGAFVGGLIFVVAFVIYFAVLGVVGVVWSVIPRNYQLLAVVVLLVAGLALLQPELDFIGVAGALFSLAESGRMLPARRGFSRVPGPVQTAGLGLVVFGAILAAGLLEFPQLAFCFGLPFLGACLGAVENYTWLLGVVLFVAGAAVFILARRR